MNSLESEGNAAPAQGLRFVLFGVFNTALTYLLYCVLVFVIHPQLAYALVFALGIALALVGNAGYVFRRPLSRNAVVMYPFAYFAQYLFTATFIYAFTSQLELGPRTALAVALIITTPISFVWNRALFARQLKQK
jgi:putative flippase GtrA